MRVPETADNCFLISTSTNESLLFKTMHGYNAPPFGAARPLINYKTCPKLADTPAAQLSDRRSTDLQGIGSGIGSGPLQRGRSPTADVGKGTMAGSPRVRMLLVHVCVYNNFLCVSAVSTVKEVEKIFVNLAPNPCAPPVKRPSVSSKFEPVNRLPNTNSGT